MRWAIKPGGYRADVTSSVFVLLGDPPTTDERLYLHDPKPLTCIVPAEAAGTRQAEPVTPKLKQGN